MYFHDLPTVETREVPALMSYPSKQSDNALALQHDARGLEGYFHLGKFANGLNEPNSDDFLTITGRSTNAWCSAMEQLVNKDIIDPLGGTGCHTYHA